MLFCFFLMNKFHQILVDMELKMLFCSFYDKFHQILVDVLNNIYNTEHIQI